MDGRGEEKAYKNGCGNLGDQRINLEIIVNDASRPTNER
jgi:hypothetical protein